jgi:hypothetical protein
MLHRQSRPNNENQSHPDYYNPVMAPAPSHNTVIIQPPMYFKTLKVMDLRFLSRASNPMPDILARHDIQVKDWMRFISVRSYPPLLSSRWD